MEQDITALLTHFSRLLSYALMAEVSTTPKPGLVDLHDNGAHKDMCFDTFAASTRAIVPYLVKMTETGLTWDKNKINRVCSTCTPDPRASDSDISGSSAADVALFRAIRPIGVEAERAMFAATGGVNTHKGMIFSMGLIAAAAGLCYARHGHFKPEIILSLAGSLCRDDLKKDFAAMDPANPKTHGERLFAHYGSRGIRGEAMDSYPSIRNIALPVMRREFSQLASGANPLTLPPTPALNRIYLDTLLSLMANVDDTNVLIRTDPGLLAFEQQEAARILSEGGAGTSKGMASLRRLNETFIRLNLSPGGCADLLAVTIFLHLLETGRYDS